MSLNGSPLHVVGPPQSLGVVTARRLTFKTSADELRNDVKHFHPTATARRPALKSHHVVSLVNCSCRHHVMAVAVVHVVFRLESIMNTHLLVVISHDRGRPAEVPQLSC